jgi:hypothetical protein
MKGNLDRYSFVVLVLISILCSAVAIGYGIRQDDTTKHDFCDIVHSATLNPVPKPADPKANPSREANYVFYEQFVVLKKRLGCGPP